VLDELGVHLGHDYLALGVEKLPHNKESYFIIIVSQIFTNHVKTHKNQNLIHKTIT
jgi:hypothetical protein